MDYLSAYIMHHLEEVRPRGLPLDTGRILIDNSRR